MLPEIIIQKIKNEGPISFCDFMEMALYYPQQGYYTSPREKIGVRGDFYTSPAFSPVFGALLAKQIAEMYERVGEEQFTIVEYGAGPGFLCYDILQSLSKTPIYDKINYCIIEKSPAMIEMAKALLPQRIKWYSSMKEIEGIICGCVLSNELVDNFAVHRVVKEKELLEIRVDHNNDFAEVKVPARKEIQNYLRDLKIEIPPDHCTEINLQALDWMQEVGTCLQKGFVITIDYGHPSSDFFYGCNKNGTLTCYHKHNAHKKPYINIGEQDITSHVNFSALCLGGYRHGLELTGFTSQRHFLTSLGFFEEVKKTETPGQDYKNYKRERALTNTLLGDMGQKFKVLIQQKNINKYDLCGLRMN